MGKNNILNLKLNQFNSGKLQRPKVNAQNIITILADMKKKNIWHTFDQEAHVFFSRQGSIFDYYLHVYSAYQKKVIHIQRPIVLKSIYLNICMRPISKEQLTTGTVRAPVFGTAKH